MANYTSFGLFHDASLTQPINADNKLPATHVYGGSLPPTDATIYFGSPDAGTKAQRASDPGVDPIVVSIVDADPASGSPATEFKLALSSGGLAAATAGASLELSNTVLSGVANAVPIYTRRTSALATVGNDTQLTLSVLGIFELPV